MPNNFEDEEEQQQFSSEFEEDGGIDLGNSGFVAEETGAAAEEFVASITKESDDTQYLSEVERRLDLAGYYRQLLHPGSIFESGEPGARQVEGELRVFAEGRLEALLGMRADDQPIAIVKPQFSDEEAAALRKFAAISEAELKVLWALLATAARSKTVMGAPPAKTSPAPAKVVPVQPVAKPAPTIRRIAAPKPAPAPVRAPAPAPVAAPAPRPAPRPAPATKPAPRPRQTAPAAPAAPAEPAAPPPPRPVAMPRGKSLEGVMMHTAISQAASGERIDESYRRRGDPDGVKVQR